jgi:hypothetical protein
MFEQDDAEVRDETKNDADHRSILRIDVTRGWRDASEPSNDTIQNSRGRWFVSNPRDD